MRLKQYINELWTKDMKGKSLEVIELPEMSMRDVDSLKAKDGEVRFTALNKNKKVYLWEAFKANHYDMWHSTLKEIAGSSYSYKLNTKVFQGVIKKDKGKWKLYFWDDADNEQYKTASRTIIAFKWLKEYFNMDDWEDTVEYFADEEEDE
jgi:hypothetical protein